MSRFAYYLPILTYHRVGPLTGDHVPTVSPEAFERHLRWLARVRYRVLGLGDVVDRLARGAPFPRRSAVITFDDGYEETYTVAWPLLKRFGVPATVFVATEEVGRKGFATWEQLAEVARDGLAIGSHTRHHSYLPLVDRARLSDELVESKRIIETRIGHPAHFLSYPVGGFTSDIQAVARQAGYRAACTTNRTASPHAVDRFALRRIKMTERDGNLLLFSAKLSGYYDLFRQLRQPS